jgi:hypothetical protein
MSSGKITVEDLWRRFKDYGYAVRLMKKNGGDAWNAVKSILVKIGDDGNFAEWVDISTRYYDHMKKKLELFGDTIKDIDGKEKNDNLDHSLWEPHHFMLQHGRIVANNKPSLLRLLQIAYNSGQLRREIETNQKAYTADQYAFYNGNDKSFETDIGNLANYISAEYLELLNVSLQDDDKQTLLETVIGEIDKVLKDSKTQEGGYKISKFLNMYFENKAIYKKGYLSVSY